MTKLLEEALAQVRKWPKERQDDAARILLAMQQQDTRGYTLTPDQITRARASKRQADAGEFVPDEEIDAFFIDQDG